MRRIARGRERTKKISLLSLYLSCGLHLIISNRDVSKKKLGGMLGNSSLLKSRKQLLFFTPVGSLHKHDHR